jgi:diguanylate cyclase (GGDEF)-like protein/PAS domain S-box-containing protein
LKDRTKSRRGPGGPLQSLLDSQQFLNTVAAGIVLQDQEGSVLDCNDTALVLLGVTREEMAIRTSDESQWPIVRQDGSPFAYEEQPARITLRTGEPGNDVIMGTGDRGRARRWLSVNTCQVVLSDGAKGVISSFIDVTQRLKKEHILEMLTDVNRLAMLSFHQDEYFHRLCEIIVEKGGYELAWLGIPSSGEVGGITILYSAGATDYLYEGMVSWLGSKEIGLGPSGTALRTGESQVVDELVTEALFEPWRERAAQFGFGSSVAIPAVGGVQRAVLSIYSRETFAFDETTVGALEDIVREAEYVVAHVRAVRETDAALKETKEAITALELSETALGQSEQRFRLVFEDNMAPMIVTDLEDRVITANNAFCVMIGRTFEEVVGHDSKPFTFPEDVGISEESHRRAGRGEATQVRYVKRYLHKDGRIIVVEVSRSPALDEDGRTLYFVISERDITEENALSIQLSHQALHDPLTGLANRALFDDRLAQAHARAARQGGQGAVLLLDLDDFKGVNDTHGHFIGDQLLVAIAHRLADATRLTDTLCRFGGDEFMYLAEGLNSPHEAEALAQRLLDALVEPISVAGARIEQRASIGIVHWNEASKSVELVQDADVALYEAKRLGKGHFVVFTPSMHQLAISRFTLVQELRHAVQAGELSMHYQPIVDLSNNDVVGFEALMRWEHPERGWVPPSVFIPLAEQSDLILELGSFALREAVAAASSWGPTGSQQLHPYVTVNLSAHQFHEPRLLSMIEEALTMSAISPDRLIIEITESVMLRDALETASVIGRLKERGVDFALDDFGTGYSSLSYLVLLHPRIIKIDQSFVRPSHESDDNDTLLETIISLGQKLGMTMLGEGIETAAQLERLRAPGCELGQGFLFSPAVPASAISKMLARKPRGWPKSLTKAR